jgi:hypothetical protein
MRITPVLDMATCAQVCWCGGTSVSAAKWRSLARTGRWWLGA